MREHERQYVNVPLYSMGSRMVSSFGLGPVTHGLGLFQPVISYNNTITISAIADRDMMPDPGFYADCLQAEFDALKKSARLEQESADREIAPGGQSASASNGAGAHPEQ